MRASSSELQAKDACGRMLWVSERLGDVQCSGVWCPEKFSRIGNNVPFKHLQTDLFCILTSLCHWPPSHRHFDSVFGKRVSFFYLLHPLCSHILILSGETTEPSFNFSLILQDKWGY